MKTDRTMLAVLALTAAALALVGCERRDDDTTRVKIETKTAADKTEGAAREAGRDIKDGAAAAGNAVADAAAAAAAETHAEKQEVDVKAALTLDTTIDASNIEVESDTASKTIFLRGSVPTADQKTRAEAAAHTKAEGYTVKNELSVGPPAGYAGGGATGAVGATGGH